jgi:hypothetical protein
MTGGRPKRRGTKCRDSIKSEPTVPAATPTRTSLPSNQELGPETADIRLERNVEQPDVPGVVERQRQNQSKSFVLNVEVREDAASQQQPCEDKDEHHRRGSERASTVAATRAQMPARENHCHEEEGCRNHDREGREDSTDRIGRGWCDHSPRPRPWRQDAEEHRFAAIHRRFDAHHHAWHIRQRTFPRATNIGKAARRPVGLDVVEQRHRQRRRLEQGRPVRRRCGRCG